MTCHGFPGPGAESAVLANPMRDYFGPEDEDRVHHVFKDFLKQHPRVYAHDPSAFERRKGHFRQNLRYINLLYPVSSCSNTGSIRDDPYWTSRKNSSELIELSSINNSLGFLL
jgi:hypothetical protein